MIFFLNFVSNLENRSLGDLLWKNSALSKESLSCIEENDFLNSLIISDEAHFHLNGFVNKQNCRFWGTENPRVIHERVLHPIKYTVWYGVTSQGSIGPFFFEDEDGNSYTVTGERYRDMLQNCVWPALENMPEM